MITSAQPLLQATAAGLYCERGGFYVDPWRPVDRAIVTHAHADHLCRGCGNYLIAHDGLSVVRIRLDANSTIATIPYGESIEINGVRVSLHPAGHILGSAQVRLEYEGRIWVVSGDYKVDADLTCAPFEPIHCHVFISECTFGLPIYRWPAQQDVLADIITWWAGNRASGRASLLYGYSLGKAQRLLAGLATTVANQGGLPGPIYAHGAVEVMNQAYRAAGIELPVTIYAGQTEPDVDWTAALVIAPPMAQGTPWTRKFGESSAAFVSGWMRIRGHRRRRTVDRGFVLSDHADWPGLLAAIDATSAETVWLTHGYTAVMARWFREQGKDVSTIETRYEGERDDMIETEKPATAESFRPEVK